MLQHKSLKLDPRKKYLQVAFNNTLEDAENIIKDLPANDRILIEAGTPLIKKYGMFAIRQLKSLYQNRTSALGFGSIRQAFGEMQGLAQLGESMLQGLGSADYSEEVKSTNEAYIVADLKTMDRAEAEVGMVADAGASAAIALGSAPIETLDSFVAECKKRGIDAMIDMMNVEYPLNVLTALKKLPPIIILHRGVDEERFNKTKMIPLHEIRRIKGRFDILISIAGGDTIREVQSSIFNDADIVVIWKSVYQSGLNSGNLVEEFLKEIK